MRPFLTSSILLLAVLLFGSACAPYFEEGSRYRTSGRVADLLLEPTLDLGTGPDQFPGSMGTLDPPLGNADGHGAFDTFVTASELPFFLPAAAGSLAFVGMAAPANVAVALVGRGRPGFWPNPLAQSARRGSAALRFAAVRIPYYAGCAAVALYDPMIHDLPVLAGRGLRSLATKQGS
jgi:hypothetical protein